MSRRTLLLADGTSYQGEAFGADREVSAEVVFTTGMTGSSAARCRDWLATGAIGVALANFSPPTASLVWLGLILVLWCVGCAPRES